MARWPGGTVHELREGEQAIAVDDRGRIYLLRLGRGHQFHFHRGTVPHEAIIGQPEGLIVRSSLGARLHVFRPTMADFVLKMPRASGIIYPKDMGTILVYGDICPGATVVEAGLGSGSLTIALLRAVGKEGRVISYEVREEFARQAVQNIRRYLGDTPTHTVRLQDIHEGIVEQEVDRVVLDLLEPWRAVEPAARALRGGGLFLAYMATVPQVTRLIETLKAHGGFALIETLEVLHRNWHVEGLSVRPFHRMVGHTGFVTLARRRLEGAEALPPPAGQGAEGAEGEAFKPPVPEAGLEEEGGEWEGPER